MVMIMGNIIYYQNYKNNYNDAEKSICSHNSLGVLQNVHAVLSTPAKIAKECNNCEIKLEIPEKIWNLKD